MLKKLEFYRKDSQLYIRLDSDFNYPSIKKIEELISIEDVESITIDCSYSKVADTEAVKFVYFALKTGVNITVVNPPDVFAKIIKVLGLEEILNSINIVKGGKV
ncbi:hypothetical protein GWK41_07950 [Persephonella atlantica]|uniref:STAS domain-containing protein n=1 Tax=Persephonella atlantica TaxID=2699429 RepID=A0ABS1GJ90_9AQUI|nr:hypothetical protein [Persephonella atlantica]MBK3332999.1 hypothetical protein [Persephonella atlantica]